MDSWKRLAWGSGALGLTALIVVLALIFSLRGTDDNKLFVSDPLAPTPESALLADAPDGFTYRSLLSRRFPVPMQTAPGSYTTRWRTGVGVPAIGPLAFDWPRARPGWYLSWSTDPSEIHLRSTPEYDLGMVAPEYSLLGMEFVPMVRMQEGRLRVDETALTELAARNPNRTWLIGNEPDVVWQDNTTPEAYATAYQAAYTAIKAGDTDAQVAIGGVSQITPLRLAYLDRVRAAYEAEYGSAIPVDVWTMHAFVLREERDNWGIGMPPGFDDVDAGILWEIEDHSDLRLVENQVRLMRSWMERNGEGDKPLWITEYGILMPEEYGFSPEAVDAFMIGSFDLFERLRDDRLGLSDDEGRMVQRWAWFSTYFHLYPTGNLFDIKGHPTALMESMSRYLDRSAE